jgi:hypothetical protein
MSLILISRPLGQTLRPRVAAQPDRSGRGRPANGRRPGRFSDDVAGGSGSAMIVDQPSLDPI